MTLKHFCIFVAAAGVLTVMAATAQAAPLLGTGNDLKIGAVNAFNVEKAAYRRCWIRHGVRHCRWIGYYDDYGYGYAPYYGYGPGIGFGLPFIGFGWGGHHHGGYHGGHGGHHH
jgi:hypothetical protein